MSKKKMPGGGKVVYNPSDAEKARAHTIDSLSKAWNIPSRNVYSNTQMGPKDVYTGHQIPIQTQYYNFGPQGDIQNQYNDYYKDRVLGYSASMYNTNNLSQGGQPINQIAANTPVTQIPQSQYEYGGKMYKPKKGVKADNGYYGDPTLPQPIDPNYFAYSAQYIPNNASLNGPDPYSPQQLIAPSNNQTFADPNNPQPIQTNSKTPKKGGQSQYSGANINLNFGALEQGIAGSYNQNYNHQQQLQDYTRNQRRTAMQQVYNPYGYGNQNSGAMFEFGGMMDGQTHELSDEQCEYLRANGYEVEPADLKPKKGKKK